MRPESTSSRKMKRVLNHTEPHKHLATATHLPHGPLVGTFFSPHIGFFSTNLSQLNRGYCFCRHSCANMSVAQFLIDLILVPGSSLKLVPVINVSLIVLFILIISIAVYIEIGAIHIFMLSFLSIGLFVSVNWFAMEYQKVKSAQESGVAIETNSAPSTTTSNKKTLAKVD